VDEHRREGEIGQSREAGNLASAVSRHDRVPGVKTGAMECEDDDSGDLTRRHQASPCRKWKGRYLS
jgi:hypothetical protein